MPALPARTSATGLRICGLLFALTILSLLLLPAKERTCRKWTSVTVLYGAKAPSGTPPLVRWVEARVDNQGRVQRDHYRQGLTDANPILDHRSSSALDTVRVERLSRLIGHPRFHEGIRRGFGCSEGVDIKARIAVTYDDGNTSYRDIGDCYHPRTARLPRENPVHEIRDLIAVIVS